MKLKTLKKTLIGFGEGLLGAAVYMGALDKLHLPQLSKSGKRKVACVGDSITYGCFVAGQPWNSYPRQLGRLLGKDYCVGNFGYTNRTAINTADFPYTAEKLYERSLAFSPDIVLIMLGTNDILLTEHPDAKRAVEKMERLLGWFKNENVPFSIAIIGPVYIADGFFEMKRYHEESRAMNEGFKALCEKRKIPFYDAGLWGIPLGYDGVHFSEEGCIRFSEKIIDILAKTHIQGHHE